MEVYVKKNQPDNFDVPQGAYDSCEIAELVGLLLLSKVSALVPPEAMGLYRDDGLIAINKTGRQLDILRKDLHVLFKKHGFKIEVVTNVTKVNYLDITFDLETGTHRPFRKPNDRPCYVHSESNHPPACLKAIPESINHRLSKLSSNQEVFKQEAPMYQRALERSGYKYKLEYKQPEKPKEKKNKRKRHRRIVWFNPPFSKHVTTPVGKRFFHILESSFPKGHDLYKIFNHDTIKLSFSTVRNMRAIVDSHNKQVVTKTQVGKEPCNCQKSRICPLGRIPGGCRATNVVYQADVLTDVLTTDETIMTYYGQTKRTFKERWGEHRNAIENEDSQHATALSNYIWKLKKEKKDFELRWSIKCRAPIYQSGSKRCLLCLKEKVCIALHDPKKLLNAKSEILHKCIHQTPYELDTWHKWKTKKKKQTDHNPP